MITVSSCGVKLQEVFSGLEKRLKHWTYMCTFVAFLNFFFLSTWGVIIITIHPTEKGVQTNILLCPIKLRQKREEERKTKKIIATTGRLMQLTETLKTHYTQLHNQRHNEQYQHGY